MGGVGFALTLVSRRGSPTAAFTTFRGGGDERGTSEARRTREHHCGDGGVARSAARRPCPAILCEWGAVVVGSCTPRGSSPAPSVVQTGGRDQHCRCVGWNKPSGRSTGARVVRSQVFPRPHGVSMRRPPLASHRPTQLNPLCSTEHYVDGYGRGPSVRCAASEPIHSWKHYVLFRWKHLQQCQGCYWLPLTPLRGSQGERARPPNFHCARWH